MSSVSQESMAEKVLVVDDDPRFLDLAKEVLDSCGVRSICVRTGEEALKLLAREKPRGLLVDGLLPGIRGDEVARQARDRYAKGALAVVFVSAFFRDMKSRTSLLSQCGVDAILHKPMSAEDLRRALVKYFRLGSASAASAGLPQPLPPDGGTGELQPTPTPSAAPVGAGPQGAEKEIDISQDLELVARYLAHAQERVQAMRAQVPLLEGERRAEALAALKSDAHRFRGNGVAFGFPELSRLGAQMERLLDWQSASTLRPSTVAQLTGLVEALAAKLARRGSEVPIQTSGLSVRPLDVMLVDRESDLVRSCHEWNEHGPEVRCFDDAASALTSARERSPDVVFVVDGRGELDGLGAVEQLKSSGLTPVVLMSRKGSLEQRLAALRRGADGFVHWLPDAAALFRVGQEYASRSLEAAVVALDPDPALLGELAQTLAPYRLTVEPCDSAESFFRALDRVEAAAAVVADESAGVSGRDLLRALRADAVHRRLPVLMLGSDATPERRHAAFEAGADDFLPKPVTMAEVAAQVRGLVFRHQRELREQAIDPMTGAFRAAYLRDACDRALRLARRGRTLALLVFEARFDEAVKEHARALTDELVCAMFARLHHGFRVSDLVARLAYGRFAVLLHDVGKSDAVRLLDAHLASFAAVPLGAGELTVQVRGGVAVFPDVNGGTDALLSAAERHLSDD